MKEILCRFKFTFESFLMIYKTIINQNGFMKFKKSNCSALCALLGYMADFEKKKI